jgi:hypothetical protein
MTEPFTGERVDAALSRLVAVADIAEQGLLTLFLLTELGDLLDALAALKLDGDEVHSLFEYAAHNDSWIIPAVALIDAYGPSASLAVTTHTDAELLAMLGSRSNAVVTFLVAGLWAAISWDGRARCPVVTRLSFPTTLSWHPEVAARRRVGVDLMAWLLDPPYLDGRVVETAPQSLYPLDSASESPNHWSSEACFDEGALDLLVERAPEVASGLMCLSDAHRVRLIDLARDGRVDPRVLLGCITRWPERRAEFLELLLDRSCALGMQLSGADLTVLMACIGDAEDPRGLLDTLLDTLFAASSVQGGILLLLGLVPDQLDVPACRVEGMLDLLSERDPEWPERLLNMPVILGPVSDDTRSALLLHTPCLAWALDPHGEKAEKNLATIKAHLAASGCDPALAWTMFTDAQERSLDKGLALKDLCEHLRVLQRALV